ncbi:hypothetical protein FMEXI_14450 [Fusarium mexicanum]|uniref:Uncharacterized protein n=1 Tax=Fusarium mexicanum TaxID=751941 RepID=A0A8H5I2L7_9HYPO|nr:hypothetical protein FMEXI_14450 [Fusarium mexicanum]
MSRCATSRGSKACAHRHLGTREHLSRNFDWLLGPSDTLVDPWSVTVAPQPPLSGSPVTPANATHPLVAGWLLVLVGLPLFATQEPRHFVLSFNMATQLLIRILNFSLTNEPTIIKLCWVQSLLKDDALSYIVFNPYGEA